MLFQPVTGLVADAIRLKGGTTGQLVFPTGFVQAINAINTGGSGITDIVFIEVKTGDSQLNAHEKEIRTAIEKGRVHYIEYRLPL